MSDFLLELSENPQARKLIKTLGLPIPVPEPLPRAQGPYEERPFDGKSIVVRATPALAEVLAKTLGRGGANSYVVGEAIASFEKLGDAWGRAPVALDPANAGEDLQLDGAIVDATGRLRGVVVKGAILAALARTQRNGAGEGAGGAPDAPSHAGASHAALGAHRA